jgi:uncharacterized RDD family membrane protein YckC
MVIVAWGGVLFGAVVLASGGIPGEPLGPWTGQAIGLVAMTLPVLLYFAACESRLRATLGKRVLGLAVVARDGGRAGFGRTVARNGIKLAPWELGHLATHHFLAAGDAVPPWLWLASVGSMLGPAWWIVAILLRGEAPYDRWSACKVTERN